MTILGIDPGFASFGFAVLELNIDRCVHAGVLRTQKESTKARLLAADDNVRRCRELYKGLLDLVARHDVRAVCAEAMSFTRQASVAHKMGLCWGALVALLEVRDLPLLQLSPQTIRRQLCDHRGASKVDVAFEVRRRIGDLDPLLDRVPAGLHEHAYDAAAVAVCCLDSDVVRALRRAAA